MNEVDVEAKVSLISAKLTLNKPETTSFADTLIKGYYWQDVALSVLLVFHDVPCTYAYYLAIGLHKVNNRVITLRIPVSDVAEGLTNWEHAGLHVVI